MDTLKEKVFHQITRNFQLMATEVFMQLDLLKQMMDDNSRSELYTTFNNNELIIDSLEVKMRTEVINTIVLYTPRATNLRIIISYYDIIAYLERIGDLALNVANFLKKIAIRETIFNQYRQELEEMLMIATKMTKNSIQAVIDGEVKLAKEMIEMDEQVDELFHRISHKLPKLHSGQSYSKQEMTDILSINSMIYNIERIADNSTNIGEAAIYLMEGANIRHLDHQNDADALLANDTNH